MKTTLENSRMKHEKLKKKKKKKKKKNIKVWK